LRSVTTFWIQCGNLVLTYHATDGFLLNINDVGIHSQWIQGIRRQKDKHMASIMGQVRLCSVNDEYFNCWYLHSVNYCKYSVMSS
jgi:hypothetical protein